MYSEREELIYNYISAYNSFDLDQMMAGMDEEVVFEHLEQGVVQLTLNGLAAFKKQAAAAANFFSERTQTVLSIRHFEDRSELMLDYRAVVAMDLPNGWRKGQEIKLSGRSVFTFRNGKIARLTDSNG